jgi:hypothetical protein
VYPEHSSFVGTYSAFFTGLLGLVVDIIVVEALEVRLDHLPSSVMLGLKPPAPHRGVEGVHWIPLQIQREVGLATEDLRLARGAVQQDGRHRPSHLVIKIS